MPIDTERLLAAPAFDQPFAYTARDTQLHALALGLGMNPLDPGQLRYVYDDAEGFEAFPTLSATLGWVDMLRDPRVVDPRWGIDANAMVIGEIGIDIVRPLAIAGSGIARSGYVKAVDKGPGKAALLCARKETLDETGAVLATLDSWAFVRGAGGFGGSPDGAPEKIILPDRTPDAVCDLATPANLALLYRLALGDHNALHADPGHARKIGFERPILHGIASLGIGVHAAMHTITGYQAAPIAGARARMTGPVFPGDTLHCELWQDGAAILFRISAIERGTRVVDGGRIALAATPG